MEFIAVFAELIGVAIVPAVETGAALLALAFELVGLVFEFVALVLQLGIEAAIQKSFGKKSVDNSSIANEPALVAIASPTTSPVTGHPTEPTRRWRFGMSEQWRRRVRIGSAIVAGVSIVSLLMVDLFGVAPAIRWSLRNLESKSGIQLQFDRATGHLLLGQVELHGIHANRKNHPSSNFDVKSERTAIHVSLWKVLWSKTGLERVVIDGLEGDYERLSKPEQHPARRGFEIGSFQMIRSRLKVTDRTVEGDPPTLDIAVQKLDCTPLRSLYAPFDLLIRATIEGTIGGHPYSVVCRKTDDSRVTEWHFRHLPVSLVGSYFGGPFEWLVAGSADIDLENRWDRAAGIKQKLKCQSVFENIRGEVPDDIGPRKRKIAELAVRYFNDHAQRMEFGFDLDLKAGRLDASSSEDLKELWNAIAEATVNAFFEVCSEKIDGFKEATREAAIGLFDKAKGAAKEHLDRLKSDRNGGDKVKPE